MANQDRIGEVYKGEIWSRYSQRRARERINWLVAQARGDVLDVGCSQGIASILCARRGLRVLGVDNEADRVEYANAERERKPAEVRERLEFRLADATALDLPDDSFDTVLLGEVLEHLPDPPAVLREVARVCKPDGRVVITTPFGYSPHHDHRSTFFAVALLDTITPALTIESIEIIADYFRLVARPGATAPDRRVQLLAELQPHVDERMFEIHRELLEERVRRARAVRKLRRLRRRRRRRRRRSIRARLGRLASRAVPRKREKPAAKRDRNLAERDRTWALPAELLEAEESRVELPVYELGEGPVARPDLTVAVILDRFSSTAFRYEWDQVEFGPDDWREAVERRPPQLLFVESAWRGNGDRWRREIIGDHPMRRQVLADLVGWCRERSIPTVFWNKEDPPNFERFIGTAPLFDWVFTVDGDCVPRYQEILGHERVGVLGFGAQPRIHNPVAVPGGRAREVAFAGTYHADKHPVRRQQVETILAPARDFGLEIFSRVQGDDAYAWPPEYESHVVGSIPYERVLAAYRAYKLFLNVNSVTESPTMCARRVFELSACATPVLSGYSQAIESVFGELIPTARDQDEARAWLEELLHGDADARDRRAQLAMRETLSKHTYGARVDEVLRTVGLAGTAEASSLSAIVVVSDAEELAHALAQLGRQRRTPSQAVLVLHGDGLRPEAVVAGARGAGLSDVVVRRAGGSASRGACLNAGLEAATGDWVAVLDPGATYDQHYLVDLALVPSYTEAGVIGKRAHYAATDGGRTELRHSESEHAFVDDLQPATLFVSGDLAHRLRFDEATPEPEADFVRRCRANGDLAYAADRFSFLAPAPGGRAALSAPLAS
jgi:SAM-dependent methyltransferase/spore maturation protein CgeB